MRESLFNIWVEYQDAIYLYNGLSGAVLSVPKAQRELLELDLSNAEADFCSPQLLLEMVKGNMLVPKGADEIAYLQRQYRMAQTDSRQLHLTIVTSLGCNFDCPYCYEQKQPLTLAPHVQEAIIQFVKKKAPNLECLRVTWFGGEPLLGQSALYSLSHSFLALAQAVGFSYKADILTNGYLLNEKTAHQLRASGVSTAQVVLDGPPHIHDRMRPLANGKGSFETILANLKIAAEILGISVRINTDAENVGQAEPLLALLQSEGLSGKIGIYLAQIVRKGGDNAPSISYRPKCLTSREFATAEAEFMRLAVEYGFVTPTLPKQISMPCTAVRQHDLVIGSQGELYKCWLTVGEPAESTGNIRDFVEDMEPQANKWTDYDPFTDPQCRSCVALPICMGGCAHLAMDKHERENRCTSFVHNHRERITALVASEQAKRIS